MPRRPSHYLQILILCTLWFFETLHSFRFYFLLHTSWEWIKFMFWRITSNLWYFFLPISTLMLESGGKGVAPRGNLNFFWNYHSKGTEIRPEPNPPPPPSANTTIIPTSHPRGKIFGSVHDSYIHFYCIFSMYTTYPYCLPVLALIDSPSITWAIFIIPFSLLLF